MTWDCILYIISITETDINARLAKAWAAINRLSVIWKSDLTDKMIYGFFQAAVMLILLYGCTIWMLTKRIEKKVDCNYTRMLQAILNKFWRQHPTKQQLYGHLTPITKTIKIRQTRHAEHCWRSRDKLISDVLLWTPSHDWAKTGWPARIYIQQLCVDTGCSPKDRQKQWGGVVREGLGYPCLWHDMMMMMMMMMMSIQNCQIRKSMVHNKWNIHVYK